MIEYIFYIQNVSIYIATHGRDLPTSRGCDASNAAVCLYFKIIMLSKLAWVWNTQLL